MDDSKIHVVEPIVTADKFELGVHRLSVPGGWIYWLHSGAGLIGTFVPHPASAQAHPQILTIGKSGALSQEEVEALLEGRKNERGTELHGFTTPLVVEPKPARQLNEGDSPEGVSQGGAELRLEEGTLSAESPVDESPVE
ncbi:MAG: hypothetical protein KGL63_05975 [Betaproteobacteria bacterium]|nr:hypothetical protein [Betaproteobacteria bacterium]